MSLGIEVVAWLDAPEGLEQVVEPGRAIDAGAQGRWRWVIARPAAGRADEPEAAVQGGGPVMVFCTEPGAGWRVRAISGGKEVFQFTHNFPGLSWVHGPVSDEEAQGAGGATEKCPWLDDPFFSANGSAADPDEAEAPAELDHWIDSLQDLRAALPAGLLDQLRALDAQDDLEMVYQCQADIFLAGLQRYGMPHDAAAVRPVLTGASVTDQELDADVGNLPRLLAALGLGPYFEEWTRRLVELDDPLPGLEEDENIAPSSNAFTLPLEPIDGCPVTLAADQVQHLCRIVWFCDPEAVLSLRVESGAVDGGGAPEGVSRRVEGAVVVYAFENPGLLWRNPRLVSDCLTGVCEGALVELGAWNEVRAGGRQRYAGPLTQGLWHVRAAYPRVSRARLEEALALAQWIRGREPLAARDEAEVEAVLAGAALQPAFYTCAPVAEGGNRGRDARGPVEEEEVGPSVRAPVEGLALRCRGWQRDALALLLFRQRFGDVWDVAEGSRIDRENHEEWLELTEIGATVPHTDEVVYEGLMGKFYRAESERFGERVSKSCQAWDEQMRALGFEYLGDFVPADRGQALRGYASCKHSTYGLLHVAHDQIPAREFCTAFGDGTFVATTTLQGASSRRDQRLLYRSSGAATAAALLEDHQAAVQRVQQHGCCPVDVAPTLEGLARTVDDLLLRVSG